jgi:hypothetical protein
MKKNHEVCFSVKLGEYGGFSAFRLYKKGEIEGNFRDW